MIRSQFIEMWRGGITVAEIAKTCRISKSTVPRIAARLGFGPRKTGRPHIDRTPILPELERRWTAGEPVQAIGRALHIENGLVTRLAAQLGLPPRKRGRAAWPSGV